MNWVEVLGIVSTLLIVFSMSCKTSSFKSAIIMRITNMIGSLLFVLYGIFLPAISTAILNGILVVVNIYHIYILCKSKDK